MQLRVNMETCDATGTVDPARRHASRRSSRRPAPACASIHSRYAGYTTNPAFDSLLAKLIVHSEGADLADVVGRARYRALCELRIDGVRDERSRSSQAVLKHPDVRRRHDLHALHRGSHRRTRRCCRCRGILSATSAAARRRSRRRALAGAQIDRPRSAGRPASRQVRARAAREATPRSTPMSRPAARSPSRAPMQGTIIAIDVRGGRSRAGRAALFVMEAMKMEHVVAAARAASCGASRVVVGDTVFAGHPARHASRKPTSAPTEGSRSRAIDLDRIRPDLAEVLERHEIGLDAARPDAVERRRKTGQRTARENIDDLCDDGSLRRVRPARHRRAAPSPPARGPDRAHAGRRPRRRHRHRQRRPLRRRSTSRCIAMSYDYTVLAGTQGAAEPPQEGPHVRAGRAVAPADRVLHRGRRRPARRHRRPRRRRARLHGVQLLRRAQRPRAAGRHRLRPLLRRQRRAARLLRRRYRDEGREHRHGRPRHDRRRRSRRVPAGGGRPDRRAVAQRRRRHRRRGRGRGGRASRSSTCRTSRAPSRDWSCADQRLLRALIPENRRRIYDVRTVHRHARRRRLGARAAPRVRPRAWSRRSSASRAGPSASSPTTRCTSPARSTATAPTRPRASCSSATPSTFRILFLCDTPGIMVGPGGREDGARPPRVAHVRHRRERHGAVLHDHPAQGVRPRRAGDGRRQLQGADVHRSPGRRASSAAWASKARSSSATATNSRPSTIPEKRKALFDEMVERMYEHGKAVNTASHFEIDDVIDPVDSRSMDRDCPALGAAARAPRRQEATEHRHVVSGEFAPRRRARP